jgi:hypothetical protein
MTAGGRVKILWYHGLMSPFKHLEVHAFPRRVTYHQWGNEWLMIETMKRRCARGFSTAHGRWRGAHDLLCCRCKFLRSKF